MSDPEGSAEIVQGQKLQLVFNGFELSLSEDEVRATVQSIFDYMFDGSLNEGFFKDLRKQAPGPGWVIASGIVISEKPRKPADQLSEDEKRLDELAQRHFRYSAAPSPRYLAEATGYAE